MVERGRPVPDPHSPFLRNILQNEIEQLHDRFIVRKRSEVPRNLYTEFIERLNGVGGANHSSSFRRIIEERPQVRPVITRGAANDGILLNPGLQKSSSAASASSSVHHLTLLPAHIHQRLAHFVQNSELHLGVRADRLDGLDKSR